MHTTVVYFEVISKITHHITTNPQPLLGVFSGPVQRKYRRQADLVEILHARACSTVLSTRRHAAHPVSEADFSSLEREDASSVVTQHDRDAVKYTNVMPSADQDKCNGMPSLSLIHI